MKNGENVCVNNASTRRGLTSLGFWHYTLNQDSETILGLLGLIFQNVRAFYIAIKSTNKILEHLNQDGRFTLRRFVTEYDLPQYDSDWSENL